MKVVRSASPGMRCRILLIVDRTQSMFAGRFMAFNTLGEACCKGISR